VPSPRKVEICTGDDQPQHRRHLRGDEQGIHFSTSTQTTASVKSGRGATGGKAAGVVRVWRRVRLVSFGVMAVVA
jgi:hypothetical protein